MRNAVPSDVAFSGEFRSHNTETVDLVRIQVLETLQEARKRYSDAIIQEELEVLFQMYDLDPNDPVVRLVTQVMGGNGPRRGHTAVRGRYRCQCHETARHRLCGRRDVHERDAHCQRARAHPGPGDYCQVLRKSHGSPMKAGSHGPLRLNTAGKRRQP